MKVFLCISILLTACLLQAQTKKEYSPKDLENWQSLGIGKAFVSHGQLMMEEGENSKGFMILSPEMYKDVVFRYEVMTMNAATVLVVLLNASDIGESAMLNLKDNSDNFGFWTKEAQDYMFGFRVMAHNNTPFLRKHPAPEGKSTTLAQAPEDVMHSGWRHTVECGKRGSRLWLKIDGETIIDVVDNAPLGAGKIAVRVRGTANELGKSMIRKLEIIGDPIR